MKKSFNSRFVYTISLMLVIISFFYSPSFAAEYDINVFDGPDGLVNHDPIFVNGDVLNLRDNLEATSDFGELAEGNLFISGNDFSIDGKGLYSGILMDSRVYNYTISNISLNNFKTSTATDFARGAALYNAENGESTILNSSFSNNISTSQNGYAQGGALYNKGVSSSAILTVLNTEFIGNETYSGSGTRFENGGGAIFNAGNTVLTVTDTIFRNNVAKANIYSYGGAIANVGVRNDSTVIKFSNLIFENNSSVTETDTGYGGAFYNNAQTKTDSYIIDSSFINNKARGFWARGGAIYNDNLGSELINNSIFKGNSAIGSKFNSTGGAFDNRSRQTVILRNCVFEDNLVESPTGGQGGAIYNGGILTLLADEGFMSFKGNLAGKNGVYVSNAIYNQGVLNINVTKSGMVSINDKIDGGGGTASVININKPGASIMNPEVTTFALSTPDEGNIVILETISNNTINLYGGIFSLGRSNQNTVPGGDYFSNVNLNLYEGLFNIANGAIDNLTLVNMTSDRLASMYLDVDLANNLSDNFTITGTGSGNVNITGINLLSDIDRVISFDVFKNSNIKTDGMSLNVYTQNAKYSVTGLNGTITFTPDLINAGLMGAVSDNTAQYRSFSAEANENITSSLGSMGGGADSMLTIFGNSLSINGNRYGGMVINDGQSVHIFSAGSSNNNTILESVNNFIKTSSGGEAKGAFAENNGVLDVFSSAFRGNLAFAENTTEKALGGVIYNSKDLSVSYSIFGENKAQNGALAAGGALYNTGNASLIFTKFIDNVAESTDGNAQGGAIYNSGDMTIINSAFTGNKAIGDTAKGGAIYNAAGGTLSLIASNTDFEFAGNTANGKSNAIYNEGIVNLNAG